MSRRKYSVAVGRAPHRPVSAASCCEQAGFRMDYEIAEGESANPDFETPDVVVKFSGPDVDLLLANSAELLLALEHVTMEALRMPSEDHSRISFDANDYRAAAHRGIAHERRGGRRKSEAHGQPFRFNPMNSRERRVIHLALRNETELRSESTGHGGFRHVVIYPAGMASLPEPPPPASRAPGAPGDGGDRCDVRGRQRRAGALPMLRPRQ